MANKFKQNRIEEVLQLLRDRKYEEALEKSQEMLSKNSRDFRARFLYGRALIGLGKLYEAKIQFQKIIDNNGFNKYSAYVGLAKIASIENDYDKACEFLKKVIKESDHNEKEALLILMDIYNRKGKYGETLKLYIEIGNNEFELLLKIVEAYFCLGKISEAKKLLEKIKKYSEDKRVINMAVELEKRYKYGNISSIERTKKINKKINEIEFKLNKKFKKSRYDGVLELIDELKDLGQIDKAIVYQGLYFERMKEYDKAVELYTQAIEDDNQLVSGKACYFLARIMFAIGRFDKVEVLLNKAINYNSGLHESNYYKLLYAYLKQEKYKEANQLIIKISLLFEDSCNQIKYVNSKALIDKALGLRVKKEYKTYSETQIYSYSRNRAIEHIRENHIGKINGKSYFDDKYNPRQLISIAEKLISSDNIICCDCMDVYMIEIPNAGYDFTSNSKTSNVIVVTLPDTKNIITMYPKKKFPAPFRKDVEEILPRLKPRRQIERFNRRYGVNRG